MRFQIFRILVSAGLVVLGIGLFHVQVIKGDYYRNLGEKNRIRLIPLEAPRGRVFDRQGNLLATNRPSYDVVATPEDVTPEVFLRLAKLLDLPEEEIRRRVSGHREYPFAPSVVKEDITRELAFKIEEERPRLPGVRIRTSGLRYYPYGETASHIIGYIGKINPQEYAKWREQRDLYGLNSLIGRMGIERIYDKRLRGWRGGRQIEVNARGQLVKVLSEKNPEPGEDLYLAIDLEFQSKIMELIKGKHAAVAIMDIESEELLALASTPSYDPNVFVSPDHNKERLEFLRDKEAPLIDRGVSSAYPPGSVFKLVTALAALEVGKITPNTRFYCSGKLRLNARSRPFKCWYKPGHGSLNLYEAVERSCNVYFYNVAKRLSPDQIASTARELGLGEAMQIESTNIAPGLVPDKAWKKKRYKERWYQGETLSYAIGQSFLLVSPLQILKLTAIIAKNGVVVHPHLLREDPGNIKKRKKVAIKEENLKVIRRAMLSVVQSDYGTGQLARVDFTKLAGKTGSAQVPPKKSHAWMTGFFPYKEPKVAFVVFIEHGGSGGLVAAKLVKEVLEVWKTTYAPAMG